jgi:hypothetical protein
MKSMYLPLCIGFAMLGIRSQAQMTKIEIFCRVDWSANVTYFDGVRYLPDSIKNATLFNWGSKYYVPHHNDFDNVLLLLCASGWKLASTSGTEYHLPNERNESVFILSKEIYVDEQTRLNYISSLKQSFIHTKPGK